MCVSWLHIATLGDGDGGHGDGDDTRRRATAVGVGRGVGVGAPASPHRAPAGGPSADARRPRT
eukprot:scaffold6062_cov161-Prasinococcus_capsulatus_cf.AAC.1